MYNYNIVGQFIGSGGFIFISYQYISELHDWKINQQQVLANTEKKYREVEESVAILTSEDYNQFNQLIGAVF
ncbi:MAG: hypothetical protein R3E08_04390 [Thiotrichaceae bacterium]